MGYPHKLKPKAKEMGMTVAEYLNHLIANNTKLEGMAMDAGVGYVTIIRALAKHGIKRQDGRHFEYGGITDSLVGHCKRLGLNHGNVERNKTYNNFTKHEAIEHGIFCQEKRNDATV